MADSDPNARTLSLAAAAHRDGRLDEAIGLYRKALNAGTQDGGVWHNLGVALAQSGDPQAAIDAFERALSARPDYLHAHINRGGALQALGRAGDAAAAYGRALAFDPTLYEVRRRQALMLVADRDETGALAAFAETRRMRRDPAVMGPDHPQFGTTSRAKLLHDAAQFQFLAEYGITPDRFEGLASDYEAAAHGLADGDPTPAGVAASHNRDLHLGRAARLESHALDRSFDGAAIERAMTCRPAGIAVIDDLLSQEALTGLYAYLLESTVWHDFSHIPGFLAAYLEDGLASPLLLQITTELRARLPTILGPHPLMQAWAFKSLSGDRGIDLHADAGAISLNLWLTPDSANLEPGAGGLVVHHTPPPAGWALSDYHGDIAKIRRFLDQRDDGATAVAYAQNRAVLFRSALFHESGRVRFRDGYANHRINLTLLFGEAEAGS